MALVILSVACMAPARVNYICMCADGHLCPISSVQFGFEEKLSFGKGPRLLTVLSQVRWLRLDGLLEA